MGKRNVALIGFRTSGKSLVGKILADRLGMHFVDMDEALVAAFGQDIDGWVAAHGWESFRRAESDLLESLAHQDARVVATGGGVILRETNRRRLEENFFVVWLQALPETIQLRMTQDPKTSSSRPPLTDLPLQEEIHRLLQDRTPLYAETADFTLSTDGMAAEDLADAIRARLMRGAGE